jgi:hypothetical protein
MQQQEDHDDEKDFKIIKIKRVMIVVIDCNNEQTIRMKKITKSSKSRKQWFSIVNCSNEKGHDNAQDHQDQESNGE